VHSDCWKIIAASFACYEIVDVEGMLME